MKIKKALITLKILGYICTPTTLVLAILWIIYPENNYEPFTVALGCFSVIILGIAQYLDENFVKPKKTSNKLDNLESNELIKVVENSNSDDWDVNYSQDIEIAVFKRDPALRIETRHTNEFIHNDDFREKWANKFPDPHAKSYLYHLYYGSTRLLEFILVSVDGGRALLPLPESQMNLMVKPIRYKVALIFDQFDSCDDYMKRAGLLLSK